MKTTSKWTWLGLLVVLVAFAGCVCTDFEKTPLFGQTGHTIGGKTYLSTCFDPANPDNIAQAQEGGMAQRIGLTDIPTTARTINVVCTPTIFPNLYYGQLIWGTLQTEQLDCGTADACAFDGSTAPTPFMSPAEGELSFAYCKAPTGAGIIEITAVAADTPCPAGFSAVGPVAYRTAYNDAAAPAYALCKRIGESAVSDLVAVSHDAPNNDSACAAGFVPLENFSAADGKNYQFCQNTGEAGLLDIDATTASVCASGYLPVQTLKGTDDAAYLICIKKLPAGPAGPVACACPTQDDLSKAACGNDDQWKGLTPECQNACALRFGTSCAATPKTPFCDTSAAPPSCIGAADVPCGVAVRPGDESLLGVKCDAGNVCDLEEKRCIGVADALSKPKYVFDLSKTQEVARAINACFSYSGGPEIVSAQNGLVHIAVGKAPDSPPAFSLLTSGLSAGLGKGGVIPFGVSNQSLAGPYNYALIKVTDDVASDGGSKPKTESFVVKLTAGESGACVGEAGFAGLTGPDAAPRVRYNWSFDDATGIAIDSCDEKQILDGAPNPDYIYCDSAQFAIELSKKISMIAQAGSEGAAAEESLLLDFNAFLMKDGFSQDFREDFDFVQRTDLVPANKPYRDLNSYFLDAGRLMMPSAVPIAGKYRVRVVIGFAAGHANEFVDSPTAHATIQVLQDLLEPSDNPFYDWPIDGRLGVNKRPNESAAGRSGYGIGFTKPLLVSPNTVIGSVSSDFGPVFDADSAAPLSRVLSSDRRGVVLEALQSADATPAQWFWTATRATPVLARVTMQNGSAAAFFRLTQNGDAAPTGNLAIANWTGAGSTLGDPCMGFDRKPLFTNSPDTPPSAQETCDDAIPQARGFSWTGTADGKSVYYKGVVYTPTGNFALQEAAACGALDLVSPADATGAGKDSVPLGYFDAGGLDSLQGLADAVKNRWLCLAKTESSTLLFWNRQQVLKALSNPEQFTPMPAHSARDFAIGPGSLCVGAP